MAQLDVTVSLQLSFTLNTGHEGPLAAAWAVYHCRDLADWLESLPQQTIPGDSRGTFEETGFLAVTPVGSATIYTARYDPEQRATVAVRDSTDAFARHEYQLPKQGE